MAILEVITPKNPILRQKAEPITEFEDQVLQQLIDDMVETMVKAPGVGLAAPQVAVSKRLIVVRLPDDEHSREEYGDAAGVLYVVINPEIVKQSREKTSGVEGCLSIPGYFGAVDRSVTAKITGYDRHGKPFKIKATGWLARVFQHEIDHLDGILFIDHATEIWKQVPDDTDYEDPLEGTPDELMVIEEPSSE